MELNSPAGERIFLPLRVSCILWFQHGEPLTHLRFTYLRRHVPVGPANRHGIYVSELVRNDRQRRAGLDKLAGICVPEPVKAEVLWQGGRSRRRLKENAVIFSPRSSVVPREQKRLGRPIPRQG